MKPVSLTAHKNTARQREFHRVSDMLVQDAQKTARCKGVAGYVLFAWNAEGETSGAFDVGSNLSPFPAKLVPSLLAQEVRRVMTPSKIIEDGDEGGDGGGA